MVYSRKNSNRAVEDIEFPKILKKKNVEFPGVNKKEVEFPGVIKKKSCEISKDLGFWPWKFQWV